MDGLNGVKLDLAAAVSACVTAVLLMAVMPLAVWIEVALLALTAVVAAGWVVLRTRSTVRRLRQTMGDEEYDGTQQE